jgi:tetrahydromethanopterin S-methyltransferase subunit G
MPRTILFTLHAKNQEQLDSLSAELNDINKKYKEVSAQLESVQTELAGLAREEISQDVLIIYKTVSGYLARKKYFWKKDRAVLQGKLQAE